MTDSNWQALHKYTACDIADALLKLNVPGAGFLADISPLPSTTTKAIAPASTFLFVPKASGSFPNSATPDPSTPPSNLENAGPYADYTESDSFVVVSQPQGQNCAVVGGIMAARMKKLGAKGLVVDGRVRDLGSLRETGVPIWSRGTSIIGAGAEAKFHAFNVPVRIGNVVVEPGDIIFADPTENGVVSIPRSKLNEVLGLLPKLVQADEKVIEDVEKGVSVKEAFKKHRSAL